MFTGIVTALGDVRAIERRDGLMRITIEGPGDPPAIGASVAHDGCCLTVVATTALTNGCRHVVEVAAESLAKTTLGALREGDQVNLERSLRAGDELGGHLVMGHVDGVGDVIGVRPDGEGRRISFKAPADLAPLIAPKGAVAVNGVSLTINEVEGDTFGVLIIPHTLAVTTLGNLKIGDKVNLEADPLARYVARMLAVRSE